MGLGIFYQSPKHLKLFFRYEVTIEGNFKTSIIGPVITITEAMLSI